MRSDVRYFMDAAVSCMDFVSVLLLLNSGTNLKKILTPTIQIILPRLVTKSVHEASPSIDGLVNFVGV